MCPHDKFEEIDGEIVCVFCHQLMDDFGFKNSLEKLSKESLIEMLLIQRRGLQVMIDELKPHAG